jgi:nicotinate-nucleotide pyrophosphorylase
MVSMLNRMKAEEIRKEIKSIEKAAEILAEYSGKLNERKD